MHSLMNKILYSTLPCFAPDDEGAGGGEATSGEETVTPSAISAAGEEAEGGEEKTDEGEAGEEKKEGEQAEGEGEKKEGEEKKEEEAKVEPLTVEQIKIPEGIQVDQEALGSFVELMNNTELIPQEKAQALVDLQLDTANEIAKHQQEAWNTLQTQWQKDVEALPDIGGQNVKTTLGNIKAGLTKAGATKETFAAFDLTGAGNHPEIVKVLNTLVKPFLEGKPLTTPANTPRGSLSQAQRMYGGKKAE